MKSRPEGRAESTKRRRNKHINKGLCRYCSRPKEENRTMCQFHLNYHKKARECSKSQEEGK